jgi:molybdopterin-binding protein
LGSIGDVASVITTRSVEKKLKIGDEVFVLVKATNISLGWEAGISDHVWIWKK